jgi:hypothetical protein
MRLSGVRVGPPAGGKIGASGDNVHLHIIQKTKAMMFEAKGGTSCRYRYAKLHESSEYRYPALDCI